MISSPDENGSSSLLADNNNNNNNDNNDNDKNSSALIISLPSPGGNNNNYLLPTDSPLFATPNSTIGPQSFPSSSVFPSLPMPLSSPNNNHDGAAAAAAAGSRELELANRTKAIISTYKHYLEGIVQEDEEEIIDDRMEDAMKMSLTAVDAEYGEPTTNNDDDLGLRGEYYDSSNNNTAKASEFATAALASLKSKTKSIAKHAKIAMATKLQQTATTATTTTTATENEYERNAIYNDYDFHNYQDDALAPPSSSSSFSDNAVVVVDLEKQDQYGYNSDGGASTSGSRNRSNTSGLKERSKLSNKKRTFTHDVNNNTNDDDDDDDDDDDGYNTNNNNSNENDETLSFQGLCNELGVTHQTHPSIKSNSSIHHFYSLPQDKIHKKQRKAILYGFILLLSCLIAISIMSAMTRGFEDLKRKNAPELPDWKSEEDRLNRQKWEWEQEHGVHDNEQVLIKPPVVMEEEAAEEAVPPPPPPQSSSSSSQQQQTPSDLDMIFESVSEAYRPIWFDRSTGYTGQTYQDAINFCTSQSGTTPNSPNNKEYIICPYEVYCPANANSLMGGIMETEGESWSPVINAQNEWVQVGTNNECELYSKKYGGAPQWGVEGVNNEAITRHVMCCRQFPFLEGSTWGEEEEKEDETDSDAGGISSGGGAGGASDAGVTDADETNSSNQETASSMTAWEQQIQDIHHPAWYSNEMGWEGTTHNDAKAFCESIPYGNSDILTLQLCPIQAYCPNGPVDTKPLFLQMDAYEAEQWAPISEGDNTWVMVGMLNNDPSSTCRSYMELHHSNPAWGVDGSATQIKKHILCCEPRGDGNSASVDNSTNGGESSAADDGGSSAVDESNSDSPDEVTSSWFPWGGGTRDEAVQFCESKDSDGMQMELCPFSPTNKNHILCCLRNVDPSGGGGEASVGQGVVSDYTDNGSSGGDINNENGNPADANPNTDLFHPYWYEWDGGSHDGAIQFCEMKEGSNGKNMELCPFHAYCPDGPSKPAIGGHTHEGSSEEGEQWSPVFGIENHWVMIGKRGNNSATTCLSHEQMYGKTPEWGLDDSMKEKKRHILCCSPLQ